MSDFIQFVLSFLWSYMCTVKTMSSPSVASSPPDHHHPPPLPPHHQKQSPHQLQQQQLISIDDSITTTNSGEPESLQYLKPANEDAVAWSEGASDLLF